MRGRGRAHRRAQPPARRGAGGAERGRAGRDRARAGLGRRGGHRCLLPAVRLRPHGRGGRRDVHARDPGGAGASCRLQVDVAGAPRPAGRRRRLRGRRRARPAARPRLRRRGPRGLAGDRVGHRALEEGGRAGGGAGRARRALGRRGGHLRGRGGVRGLMHLKSITLKGFKSFPDRTRLEFGEGVSVIVGPNGSGKSNVTDAVLWALGEQSPLAVRGQSMQDVIFGGGKGVQARTSAEVELVLDNAGGSDGPPVGGISILRRLDRSGDGEYRLNGARCRLVDVIEVLSDTGLGKEMHSVISQGRVEAIITSKPRDRRLLLEEAAGLGKHRKRRRRAQLKLERTQENLDRALDVEREARSRLRPLKRQAEAAELHERLERQTAEARWELARESVRARRAALAEAEQGATAARAAREAADAELAEVAARREQAEAALAARSEEREALAQRVFAARAARERVELRLERVSEAALGLTERLERRRVQIAALEAEAEADAPDEAGRERIEQLEAELERLDRDQQAELERELASLEEARREAEARVASLGGDVETRRAALADADTAAEAARRARHEADRAVEAARRDAARVGAELAAANQFLRTHAGAPG